MEHLQLLLLLFHNLSERGRRSVLTLVTQAITEVAQSRDSQLKAVPLNLARLCLVFDYLLRHYSKAPLYLFEQVSPCGCSSEYFEVCLFIVINAQLSHNSNGRGAQDLSTIQITPNIRHTAQQLAHTKGILSSMKKYLSSSMRRRFTVTHPPILEPRAPCTLYIFTDLDTSHNTQYFYPLSTINCIFRSSITSSPHHAPSQALFRKVANAAVSRFTMDSKRWRRTGPNTVRQVRPGDPKKAPTQQGVDSEN